MEWTVLIVIWLITGTAGALIAQSKNRSPVLGAVIGFFFGLIGVIVMACLSRKPEKIEPIAPGEGWVYGQDNR